MDRYHQHYQAQALAKDPRYQQHYHDGEDSEEEAHAARARVVSRGGPAAGRGPVARGRGRVTAVRGGGRVGGRGPARKRAAESDVESEEEDSDVPDEDDADKDDDEDEDEAVEVRKVVEQVRAPNKRQVKVPKHLLED